MKTFKCDFGGGVTCEVKTTDDPPAPGGRHVLEVQWTGSPSIKHVRPYIGWMNSVNKQLADLWNTKLMHIYQLGARGEILEPWVFEPGQPPQKATL